LASLLSDAARKKPAPEPPQDVLVMTEKPQDTPGYKEWIGTLDGLVNAQIRAQVTGYLLTQNYSEGSQVKKGDLLFQIDPRPFEAALSQAQAKLGAAVFVLSRCRRFSARLADAEEVIAIRFRRKTPSRSLESRNFRILVWILFGVFASLTSCLSENSVG
jgi:multidrug resistance efflux pump